MISEEWAAYFLSEEGIKIYGGLFERREGELDEDFRKRATMLWLVEQEEYELYGQFCVITKET